MYNVYCCLSTCGPRTCPQKPVWPRTIKMLETKGLVVLFLVKYSTYSSVLKGMNIPGGWNAPKALRLSRRKEKCCFKPDIRLYTAHLRQQCHNSKSVIFQEKLLKVLKCYNFQ